MEQVVLTGFKDITSSQSDDLQRVIDKAVNSIKQRCGEFEELKLVRKEVHKKEMHMIHEIHASLLIDGSTFRTHREADRLIEAVDDCLKTLIDQL